MHKRRAFAEREIGDLYPVSGRGVSDRRFGGFLGR
jgi:hypothetical protein